MILQNLKHTMENFYLCSHLPIKAFNNEGVELLSIGFEDTEELICSHYISSETLKKKRLQLNTHKLVHYFLSEYVCCTLCNICPHDPSEGFFMIGPYTTKAYSTPFILFKPSHCIDHLVALLYSIASDKTQDKSLENTNYHVTRAEIYIQKHYAEPLTLEKVSNYLGINKSYFCTLFKKATNQSFSSYITALRIEKSKHLLHEDNHSILDIALSSGFSSASYYTTTFKKLTGLSPLEYRHRLTKK